MKLKTATGLMAAVLLGSNWLLAGPAMAAEDTPYLIQDGRLGYATWIGMTIYQRGRCEVCHGADGKGGVGFPNLLKALKTTSTQQLTDIVTNGSGSMPPMLQNVMGLTIIKTNGYTEAQAMDALYAYLKGRSDGAVPAGNLKPID